MNLTTQFMNDFNIKDNNFNLSASFSAVKKPTKIVTPTEVAGNFKLKKKSKSDSNLFQEFGIQSDGASNRTDPTWTENKPKQTKSEMRDTNIVSDSNKFSYADSVASDQHGVSSESNVEF